MNSFDITPSDGNAPASVPTPSAFGDQTLLSGPFWGELRMFLAVAKGGSFNKAAEILGTSHPTVSRQVKRLQDMMGLELVEPTKAGVRLTAKGEELAHSLASLDTSLFALTNDLKADSRDAEGRVRVSITNGLNAAFVTPNLRRFSADHPRIQVSLNAPKNINDLREDQIDIMIGFGMPSAAEMHVQQLGILHFIPLASRDYIRANGLPNRSNIAQHRFIHADAYSAGSGHWDRWLNAIHLGRIAHTCEDPIAYAILVKSGAGIGLLGSYTILDPSLMPVDLDIHVMMPIVAVALSERLKSKPVRLFHEWICELLSPKNPWFAPELNLENLPNDYDLGFRLSFNI